MQGWRSALFRDNPVPVAVTATGSGMTFSIGEIAARIGAEVAGDESVRITRAAEPQEAGPADLAIAISAAFLERIGEGSALAALVPSGTDWQALGLRAAILVPRGRLALAGVTRHLDPGPGLPEGRHPTALVPSDAELGEGVGIGAFSVLGDRVRVGAGSRIGHHVTIGAGTEIGPGCRIHHGVRIGPGCRIGAGTILHPNVVIGADGFSFVTETPSRVEEARTSMAQIAPRDGSESQVWNKIHSLGGVEIGEDVEIGAGSTVDAGTIRATRIGRGTKIDNLVQVGHNVVIGEDCLLSAQSGVAGSARIGDRTVLGGKAGVADNITVGPDVVLGGGSIALSNVPAGRIMLGYPAMPIEAHLESYRALRRLPRMLDRFRPVKKPVPKPGESD